MNRERLNKEMLIADAFFSPTCRYDFVGLSIRRSDRGKDRDAWKGDKVSQQPRREKEREKERAGGRGRRGRIKAEISFPRTLLPSTPRQDTRVGLTDLPRNANRYTHYTRRTINSVRHVDWRSFRQRSHERVPTRPALSTKNERSGAEFFIRDEYMNNAKMCAVCKVPFTRAKSYRNFTRNEISSLILKIIHYGPNNTF